MTESCESVGCSRLSTTVASGMDFVPIARLSRQTAASAGSARLIPAVRVTRRGAPVMASLAVDIARVRSP
jgi:hypothetical protein